MKLQEYLQERKMTVQELAGEVGLSRSHLSCIMHRHRVPSPEVAKAIEYATGGKVTRMHLTWPDDFP